MYDDIYIDMTFVEILEKHGLDAPVDSFALSFAKDDYKLWHANQAARYNILNGIMPPASGHWMNNPHADDIDFQIEADFAGMMTPGMIKASSAICDTIGHIMNYGDGFYGRAFISAMYSAAYVTDDMNLVIREALSVIPAESRFYKTIADVIAWHKQYPDDAGGDKGNTATAQEAIAKSTAWMDENKDELTALQIFCNQAHTADES